MTTSFKLGEKNIRVELPDSVDILQMKGAPKISDHRIALTRSLENPLGSEDFDSLVKRKVKENPLGEAVIVISDNTRPVPYKGEQGILLPLVDGLLAGGVPRERITVLCANGTHLPLADEVFRDMLDPRVYDRGVRVINHDCLDKDNLEFLGYSKSGTKIEINRIYTGAHIKILTGLVESHFMAGVSGGRKSICPGLVGEDSTFLFHGVDNLAHPLSRDLVLEGNPCHDEALDVALTVGADFILNVILDEDFQVTGYFAGDMVKAHMAAYEMVKKSVTIETDEKYDIVLAHAGFVGKNHYQAAKTGTAAIPLLKEGGFLVIGADCNDTDPVGKATYRQVLPYLKGASSDDFIGLLRSDEWTFIPDQWQVQMWAKLFRIIPQNHFFYYAPQISRADYSILPGEPGSPFVPEDLKESDVTISLPAFFRGALDSLLERLGLEDRKEIKIAWLADGPYGLVQGVDISGRKADYIE